MPYYSSNQSKSGTKRGGISHHKHNALVDLAQQLMPNMFNGNVQQDNSPNSFRAFLAGITKKGPDNVQSGTPGGLYDLLGQTLASSRIQHGAQRTAPKSLTNNPGGSGSDLNHLFNMLAGSISNGGGGVPAGFNQADYEQALNDSAAQIKKAFGNEIGAVRIANQGARHDTKRANKQIAAMYRALSKDYARGAKGEIKQGKQLANAVQNVADRAQGKVSNTVNQQLDQQAALAKGLGVQSAMPSVAAAQQNQLTKNVGQIQQRGQRGATDVLKYSGDQQRYLNSTGQGTLLEGTNRRADMLSALQDYINGNRSKIADIRGQRANALASNEQQMAQQFQDMQGKAADAQQQAQQDQWNQLMQLANLKLQIENTQADNKLNFLKYKQGSQSGTGGGGLLNYAPNNMADVAHLLAAAPHSKADKSLLDALMHSTTFSEGRYQAKNGDTLSLSPIAAANEAEKQARKQGITNPKDIALIRLAAMQAVG